MSLFVKGFSAMLFQTVRLSSLPSVHPSLKEFFTRTAYVIAHKHESPATLDSVLWFLPIESPVIVVSNCLLRDWSSLLQFIRKRHGMRRVYVVHQKDRHIAAFFSHNSVESVLNDEGQVRDGKGEGMYIGTLCALLLGFVDWIVYYDADNYMPSALLEYSAALGTLFQSSESTKQHASSNMLHDIRICWSSKPSLNQSGVQDQVLGRCTRVVSPLVAQFFQERSIAMNEPLVCSNAGEQAMTVQTAKSIQFSSGYSVETYQLLALLDRSCSAQAEHERILVQQYLARSMHVHEKGDEAHIVRMILQSLGCFLHFPSIVSQQLISHVEQSALALGGSLIAPQVYPALETLALSAPGLNMHDYLLSSFQVAPDEDVDTKEYVLSN